MIKRQSLTVSSNMDSDTQLEILKLKLGVNPSFGSLRLALELVASYEEEELKIARPGSEYDCTGKSFTLFLDRLSRNIMPEENEYVLVLVYMHTITYDI